MIHPFHLLKIYFVIIIQSTPVPSLRFPHQKPIRTSHTPHTCYIHRPSQFFCFDDPNNIWWGYRSLSSSLRSLLQTPFTSSLLGPNILLRTLCWNTFNQSSSLNVKDQVSHSYKTIGKIIVLYTLIFILPVAKWKKIRFCKRSLT